MTLRELLDLFGALKHHVAFGSIEDFYMLSRTVMVKDEKYYDRFDRAFAHYFEGLESIEPGWLSQTIPEEWLRKQMEKTLSAEEREKLQGLGSLEKILEELKSAWKSRKSATRAATNGSAPAAPARSAATARTRKGCA